MRIIKTVDKNYPIKLDDSWGDDVYLDFDTVFDDEEWNLFLNELKKIREEIVKKRLTN